MTAPPPRRDRRSLGLLGLMALATACVARAEVRNDAAEAMCDIELSAGPRASYRTARLEPGLQVVWWTPQIDEPSGVLCARPCARDARTCVQVPISLAELGNSQYAIVDGTALADESVTGAPLLSNKLRVP